MTVEFLRQFERDIRQLNHGPTVRRIQARIEQIRQAENIQEIPNLRKLRGFDDAYRIRIGDYRMGLFINQNTVTFARFLHRKEIYRFFP